MKNKILKVQAESEALQQKLTEQTLVLQKLKHSYRKQALKTNRRKRKRDQILKSRSWRFSMPVRKYGSLLKKTNKHSQEKREQTSEQETEFTSSAKDLESRLWGGYSTYALDELMKLQNDSSASTTERMRALKYIVQWYYNRHEFQEAYEYLTEMNELSSPTTRIGKEIKILKQLGKIEEGKRKVWNAIQANGLQSNLCLAMSHITDNKQEKLMWYNLIFDQYGYEKIHQNTEPLELGNLSTGMSVANPELNQYKVSIIIPAYNAEDFIHIPLHSLRNQSVQNWEIIVVDDCSVDQTANVVSEFAELDERIKLICKDRNEGAYAARNTGLQYVSGDFITIHDSDDWSHPQKIEVQLEKLIDQPDKVCSISFLVRVDKTITPLNPGSLVNTRFLQSNTSSLLFHKKVVNKLGGWDRVRVAGDTEFLRRIKTVFGKESVAYVEPGIPFSLSLSHDQSLTGTSTTNIKTILFGLRRSYREAAEWWHNQVKSNEDLYVDPSKSERLFPCPVPNLVNNTPLRKYERMIVADCSAVSNLDRLESMLAYYGSEGKIAIFHWPDYKGDPSKPIADRIYQFMLQNEMDIVVPHEKVETKQLVILTPRVLNFALDQAPAITCDQAMIVRNKQMSTEQKVRKERNLQLTLQIEAEWIVIEENGIR